MKRIWLCVDKSGNTWGDGTKDEAEHFATAPTDRVVQFEEVGEESAADPIASALTNAAIERMSK